MTTTGPPNGNPLWSEFRADREPQYASDPITWWSPRLSTAALSRRLAETGR